VGCTTGSKEVPGERKPVVREEEEDDDDDDNKLTAWNKVLFQTLNSY
jgi:hypothetical protein